MAQFRCYHCGHTLDRAALRCPHCDKPLQPRLLEKVAAIRSIIDHVQVLLEAGEIEPGLAGELKKACLARIAVLVQQTPVAIEPAPPSAAEEIPYAQLAEEPSSPSAAPRSPVFLEPTVTEPPAAPRPAPPPAVQPAPRPAPARVVRYLERTTEPPPLEPAIPPTPPAPSLWEEKVKPFLRDTYLWFLGAFLVVTGSIYMVVTTWSSMQGITKQMVVHGGLLALGLGWFGLGRVSDRRLHLGTAARVFYGIFLAGGPGLLLVPGQILPDNVALGGALAVVSFLLLWRLGQLAASAFDHAVAPFTALGYALLCAAQLVPALMRDSPHPYFFQLTAYTAAALLCLALLVPARRLFPGGVRSAHGASWLHLCLCAYALLALMANLYVQCGLCHVRASETWCAPVAILAALALVALERKVARREGQEPRVTVLGFGGICLAFLSILLGLRDLDYLLVACLGATYLYGLAARQHRKAYLLVLSLLASFCAYGLLYRVDLSFSLAVRDRFASWLGYARGGGLPWSFLALAFVPYLAGSAVLASRCREGAQSLLWVSISWLWLVSLGVALAALFAGTDARAGLLTLPACAGIALFAGQRLARVEFLLLACAEVVAFAWAATEQRAWSYDRRAILFEGIAGAYLLGGLAFRRRDEQHRMWTALYSSSCVLQAILTALLALLFCRKASPELVSALLACAAVGTLLSLVRAGAIPWHGAIYALVGAAFEATRLRWPGDADALVGCSVGAGFGLLGLGVLLRVIRSEERREMLAGPLPVYAILATTGACAGAGWIALDRGITQTLLWIVLAGAGSFAWAAADRGWKALTHASLAVLSVDLVLWIHFAHPHAAPEKYAFVVALWVVGLAAASVVTGRWAAREGIAGTWFAPLGPFALTVAALLGIASLAVRSAMVATTIEGLGKAFPSWFLWTQIALVGGDAILCVAARGGGRDAPPLQSGVAGALTVLSLVLAVVGDLDRAGAPTSAYALAFSLLAGGIVFASPLFGEAARTFRVGAVLLWTLALIVGAVAWPSTSAPIQQGALLAVGVTLGLVAFLFSEGGAVGWTYAGLAVMTVALDLCGGVRLLKMGEEWHPLVLLLLGNVYATVGDWTKGEGRTGFADAADRFATILASCVAAFGAMLFAYEAFLSTDPFTLHRAMHFGASAVLAATTARLAWRKRTPWSIDLAHLGLALFVGYLAPLSRLLAGEARGAFLLPSMEVALLAIGCRYLLRAIHEAHEGGEGHGAHEGHEGHEVEDGTPVAAYRTRGGAWSTTFAWLAVAMTQLWWEEGQKRLATPITLFLTTWFFFVDTMERKRAKGAWVYSMNLCLAFLLTWGYHHRVYGKLLSPETMLPLVALTVLAYALFLLHRSEKALTLPAEEFGHALGVEHLRIAHVLALGVVGMQCAAYLLTDRRAIQLLDYMPPVAAILLMAGMTHATFSSNRPYFLFLAQALGLATWIFLREQTDLLRFAEGYDAHAMVVFGATALLFGMFTTSKELKRTFAISAGLWPVAGAYFLAEHLALGSVAGFLLLASVHYAVCAVTWRSRAMGYLAGALFNVGLWCFWVEKQKIDPQFYGIPFGLTVIGFAELNKKEFKEQGLGFARSFGLLCIYGSSAYHVLVGGELIYAGVLGALSIVGVLAGLAREERSYVFFGTAFLVIDVLGQLIRMGLKMNIVVPLAIILTGGTILGLSLWAAAKKKRREEAQKAP